jgi:Terpene synthase family 2, C-terminal metal binding
MCGDVVLAGGKALMNAFESRGQVDDEPLIDAFGEAMLSLVPPADRALVRTKAWRLCEPYVHSGQKAGQYGARTVAVTVAAMAPMLPDDKLAILFRYCLWTIELDARLDTAGVEEARQVAGSLRDMLRDAGATGPAGLGTGLTGILAGLRAHDPDGWLVDLFVDALCDAATAAVDQAELGRRTAGGQVDAPSAADYLDLASRDVNFRSVALALLILVGERPSRRAFAPLDEAISLACRAVRLANDLTTAAKDHREKHLNVLALRTRDGARVTYRDVECWIDRYVQAHLDLLAEASTAGLSTSPAALANSLRMAVGLYRLAGSEIGGTSHVVRHPRGANQPPQEHRP